MAILTCCNSDSLFGLLAVSRDFAIRPGCHHKPHTDLANVASNCELFRLQKVNALNTVPCLLHHLFLPLIRLVLSYTNRPITPKTANQFPSFHSSQKLLASPTSTLPPSTSMIHQVISLSMTILHTIQSSISYGAR